MRVPEVAARQALASPPGNSSEPPCHCDLALFRSPALEIAAWRCIRDGEMLRAVRQHAWPAFTFVHEGAYLLHTEGRTELVDPAHVSFQGVDSPYATSHPFGVGDRGMTVAIRPDLYYELYPEATVTSLGLRSTTFALRDLQLALRLRQQPPADPFLIEEEALQLVGSAVRARHRALPGEARASRDEHRDLAERARAILALRFREPLQLSDLAAALRVSPFHLSRVFRRETGVSLHRYLTRLRLLASMQQAGEAAGFSQLALELGFSSHSHFTSAFRREFGVAPREARRSLAEA
jgi:AraC-like DNA-binding protein